MYRSTKLTKSADIHQPGSADISLVEGSRQILQPRTRSSEQDAELRERREFDTPTAYMKLRYGHLPASRRGYALGGGFSPML